MIMNGATADEMMDRQCVDPTSRETAQPSHSALGCACSPLASDSGSVAAGAEW